MPGRVAEGGEGTDGGPMTAFPLANSSWCSGTKNVSTVTHLCLSYVRERMMQQLGSKTVLAPNIAPVYRLSKSMKRAIP